MTVPINVNVILTNNIENVNLLYMYFPFIPFGMLFIAENRYFDIDESNHVATDTGRSMLLQTYKLPKTATMYKPTLLKYAPMKLR